MKPPVLAPASRHRRPATSRPVGVNAARAPSDLDRSPRGVARALVVGHDDRDARFDLSGSLRRHHAGERHATRGDQVGGVTTRPSKATAHELCIESTAGHRLCQWSEGLSAAPAQSPPAGSPPAGSPRQPPPRARRPSSPTGRRTPARRPRDGRSPDVRPAPRAVRGRDRPRCFRSRSRRGRARTARRQSARPWPSPARTTPGSLLGSRLRSRWAGVWAPSGLASGGTGGSASVGRSGRSMSVSFTATLAPHGRFITNGRRASPASLPSNVARTC